MNELYGDLFAYYKRPGYKRLWKRDPKMSSTPKLQLVSSRRESLWDRVTCGEAKDYADTHIIWWRPNMTMYSDTPDNDLAWVRENK